MYIMNVYVNCKPLVTQNRTVSYDLRIIIYYMRCIIPVCKGQCDSDPYKSLQTLTCKYHIEFC